MSKKDPTKPSRRKNTAGGAATHAGVNYQNLVAAYFSVVMLSQEPVGALLELRNDVCITSVSCETLHPIDDISLRVSENVEVLVQAKRNLDLSTKTDSDFAKTLRQFVQEYVTLVSAPSFDASQLSKKRFILATSSGSSGKITAGLRMLLNSGRLSASDSVASSELTAEEQDILGKTREHVGKIWREETKLPFNETALRNLLSITRVFAIDIEAADARHRIDALRLLRDMVLAQPDRDEICWNALLVFFQDASVKHLSINLSELRHRLLSIGVNLQAPPSYKSDVLSLNEVTERIMTILSEHQLLRIGNRSARIERSSVPATVNACESNSFLVVGEPGSGKSGVMSALAEQCRTAGFDIVLLSLERLTAGTDVELAKALNLAHPLVDVLQNWTSQNPRVLLIDGLDAARMERPMVVLRDLITALRRSNTSWNVVVAVRRYDLRYSSQLHELFAGPAVEGVPTISEFRGVQHSYIGNILSTELEQLKDKLPELFQVTLQAPAGFLELLQLPINLRLLCSLVERNVPVTELHTYQTQTHLLHAFWRSRIQEPMNLRQPREALLREICRQLFENGIQRLLSQSISSSTGSLSDLSQQDILREWEPTPGKIDDRIMTFSHAIIQDFATSYLLFPSSCDAAISYWETHKTACFRALPAIEFYLRSSWLRSPSDFWAGVLAMARSKLPRLIQVLGSRVAATSARDRDDLVYVVGGHLDSLHIQVLHDIVLAVMAEDAPKKHLTDNGAKPWCELLLSMAKKRDPRLFEVIRPLLGNLVDYLPRKLNTDAPYTSEEMATINSAASEVLEIDSVLTDHAYDRMFALQALCRTYLVDPQRGAAILRRYITRERLRTHGHQDLYTIANEIPILASNDPELTHDIYRLAFSVGDVGETPTVLAPGLIMGLSSTTGQDYRLALSVLAENFQFFLAGSPEMATRTVIDVVGRRAMMETNFALSNPDVDPTQPFDDTIPGIPYD